MQALTADPQVVYVECERVCGAHLAGHGPQRELDHDDHDGHAIRVAAAGSSTGWPSCAVGADRTCRFAELRTAVEDAGCDPRGEYRLVA